MPTPIVLFCKVRPVGSLGDPRRWCLRHDLGLSRERKDADNTRILAASLARLVEGAPIRTGTLNGRRRLSGTFVLVESGCERSPLIRGELSVNGSVNTNPYTYFDNFNFNTGSETSSTSFTSTSGGVDIAGAAVPEPASIVSGLTALLILGRVHRVRRLRRPRH